jgi:hypothetical protein
MRGDEERVVSAFCRWLDGQGWAVQREVDFCDVVARRDDETLYAEAKGRTAAIGLDVDTMYGQLLRRVPLHDTGSARFGVVVPTEARAAALRVPEATRRLLRITVYVVDETGQVETVSASSSSEGSPDSSPSAAS